MSSSGLLAPERFTAQEADPRTTRLAWSTAYAGRSSHRPLRDRPPRGQDRHRPLPPQLSEEPFTCEDRLPDPGTWPGGKYYKVRVVDARGNVADTATVKA